MEKQSIKKRMGRIAVPAIEIEGSGDFVGELLDNVEKPEREAIDDKEFNQLAGPTPEQRKQRDEERRQRAAKLSKREKAKEMRRRRNRVWLAALKELLGEIPDVCANFAKAATLVAVLWSLWRAIEAAQGLDRIGVILHLSVAAVCAVINERM